MDERTKSGRKAPRRPVLIAIALSHAKSLWGDAAMVRETRYPHGKLCEVGVADTSVATPPWPQPLIVFGSSWSWDRAFAAAATSAAAQQAAAVRGSQPAVDAPEITDEGEDE